MTAVEEGVLAVIVRFRIAPEMVDLFMQLVSENARLSRQLEPGCLRFDVLRPEADGSDVVLFELYQTADDFADHLARPHFLRFEASSQIIVLEKVVERLTLCG